MRRLVYVAAVLAVLLSATWFVIARQVETRARMALADLEANGWLIDVGELSVTGFPSQFDTTLTKVQVASPDRAIVWEAPSFRVTANSYQPTTVFATWPQAQRVIIGRQEIGITAQDLGGSASVGLSTNLPLRRVRLESGLAAVESTTGWGFGMNRLVTSAEWTGSQYDISIQADGLRPATVSASIGLARLDAQVRLNAPLELRSGTQPELTGLSLREFRLAQGDVALTGTGALAPDAQGFLAGNVTVAVDNWRGFLDLLEAAGVLVYDQRQFVEGALEGLARGGDRIEVPVTFLNGQVKALGLVLTNAPRVP